MPRELIPVPLRPSPPLRNHAIHLEHLGVLAVHVDAVCPRDVPHVFTVRVAAVLLWGVLLGRCDPTLDMPALEREVRLGGEGEVVPRELVGAARRSPGSAAP